MGNSEDRKLQADALLAALKIPKKKKKGNTAMPCLRGTSSFFNHLQCHKSSIVGVHKVTSPMCSLFSLQRTSFNALAQSEKSKASRVD